MEFAILFHSCPQNQQRTSHWDLLLELPDPHRCPTHPLLTFEVQKPPSTWFDGPLTAIALPNHRRIYLEYEGEISGNRGSVTRIARGQFQWIVCKENLYEIVIKASACLTGTQSKNLIETEKHDIKLILKKQHEDDRWILNLSLFILPADEPK